MSSHIPQEWIVLLEAVATEANSTIDRAVLGRLVASWPKPAPTALLGDNRYALQAPIRANGPAAAVRRAIGLWEHASRLSRVPRWNLVRAEIVTPEELDRELLAADCENAESDSEDLVPSEDGEADALLRGAFFDRRTGLPRREAFLDAVRQGLTSTAAEASLYAVLVVETEEIRPGRYRSSGVADDLAEVASRLAAVVRSGDTVAFLGGNAFGLFVSVSSEIEVDAIARRLIAAARRPGPGAGRGVVRRARIGVATGSWQERADDLLRRAEMATEAPASVREGLRAGPLEGRGAGVGPHHREGRRCATGWRITYG